MVHEIHIKRVFGHSSLAQSTKEKMVMALSNKRHIPREHKKRGKVENKGNFHSASEWKRDAKNRKNRNYMIST